MSYYWNTQEDQISVSYSDYRFVLDSYFLIRQKVGAINLKKKYNVYYCVTCFEIIFEKKRTLSYNFLFT